MSLFPDLTPLVNEIKEFKQQQHQIISLLQEQNEILKKLSPQ
ncbi:MAG: hypothetical protein GBAus27B_000222 [Mycoplasmataceae bacterium]|nr:MAG: hypothetical protein GBAus27B_000222 [Mycoplasmataceae bacterium]